MEKYGLRKINLKDKKNLNLSSSSKGVLKVNEDFNYHINPKKIEIKRKKNIEDELIKNRLKNINVSKKERGISFSKQESITSNLINNNNSDINFEKEKKIPILIKKPLDKINNKIWKNVIMRKT